MKTYWKVLLAGVLLWALLVSVSMVKMRTSFDRLGASNFGPADYARNINRAVIWGIIGNAILIISVVTAIYMWRRTCKRSSPRINNH